MLFSNKIAKTGFRAEDRRVVILKTITIFVPLAILGCVGAYLHISTLHDKIVFWDIPAAFAICLLIGLPTIFVLMVRNQQLAIMFKKMETLASTDTLTGAHNRGAFTTKAEKALAQRAQETFPGPVSFLAIDVDKFKSVNDRFGHQAGDKALILIAKTLIEHTRETDVLGRLGGEEFGVFMPNTDATAAMAIAQGMRRAVSEIHFSPEGQIRPLSISIGASSTIQNVDLSKIYKRADDKLLEAKSNGRNNVKACGGVTTPIPALTSSLLH